MKPRFIDLPKRYVVALRNHLNIGSQANLKQAVALGRQAVGMGLETLEVARMHEQALVKLKLSDGKAIQRAETFFIEAITPIVETHRAARQNKINFDRVNEALSRRTLELAATSRQLQRGIVRRKTVEAALKKSGKHFGKLLKDSLNIQEGLRQLTHQVFAAQEEERRQIGRELQDEVAQTLLGINVRLHSLKKEARRNTKGLKNEIASAQRLVVKSAQSVRRVAREYGIS
jgi:signal transduction histidine kinase